MNSTIDPVELAAYKDAIAKLNLFNNPFQFFGAIVGVISSILTLMTISGNPHFNAPCFVCYEALAISELIYCAIGQAPKFWFEIVNQTLAYDYVWVFWVKVISPAVFSYLLNVDTFLISFLSLQRFVACTVPSKYHLVNTRGVCLGVTIAIYLLSVPYIAPTIMGVTVIWKNQSQIYVSVASDFGKSETYKEYNDFMVQFRTIQGVIVLVTSVMAIYGMLKASALKKRLFQESQQSPGNAEAMKAVKRNLQLCYLQMTQAVPFVLNRVFSCIAFQPALTDEFVYDSQGNIISTVQHAITNTVLWQIAGVWNITGHYIHFFLYMIFSQSFRDGFAKRYRRFYKHGSVSTVKSVLGDSNIGGEKMSRK